MCLFLFILLCVCFLFLEMPRPPTDLKVSHIGTRELVITWKHGKHNSTVAYTIIKYMEYKHSPIIRKQFGDNSSYTISGLKPYKDYVLSVSTCFDNSLVSDFCSGESEKIEKKTSIDGEYAFLVELYYFEIKACELGHKGQMSSLHFSDIR